MLGSVGKSALERYVASNPDFTGREEKGLLSLPGVEERGAAPHHPAVH